HARRSLSFFDPLPRALRPLEADLPAPRPHEHLSADRRHLHAVLPREPSMSSRNGPPGGSLDAGGTGHPAGVPPSAAGARAIDHPLPVDGMAGARRIFPAGTGDWI